MAMLVFALLAVFIAGLMVGLTALVLGKKIQGQEMNWRRSTSCYPQCSSGVRGASVLITPPSTPRTMTALIDGLTRLCLCFTSAFDNTARPSAACRPTYWYDTMLPCLDWAVRLLPWWPCPGHRRFIGAATTCARHGRTFATVLRCSAALFGVGIIRRRPTYFPVVALGPVFEHL